MARRFKPGVRVTRTDGEHTRTGTLVRRIAKYAEWLVQLDADSVYPPGRGDTHKFWAERDMKPKRG